MSHADSRFWPTAVVVILCAPLILTSVLLVWHVTYIAFFAPRETVELYQFGSECTGWRHQSRMIYFLSGVAEAALMLATSALLAWWLLRRPRRRRPAMELSLEGEAD